MVSRAGIAAAVVERFRRSSVPLRDHKVRRVAAAYSISSIGNYLTTVAIAFAVLEVSGSVGDLGLVLACRTVPSLALTLIGGAWADRLPRNKLMATADLASTAAVGASGVLLLTGSARIWTLCVCMAVAGMAAAFFRPSTIGMVRELVDDDGLQATNALLSTIQSGAAIIGPALGGLLVAAASPGVALCADALSFTVSAVLLAGTPTARRQRRDRDTTVWQDIGEGYREVRSKVWLQCTIAQMAIFQCTALAAVNTLGPLVAQSSLGGAKSWGLIVTGFAAGTLAGAVLAGLIHPRRLLVAALLPGLLIIPTLALLAYSGPVWALVLTQFLTGTGIVFSNTVYTVALQQQIPEDKLSRVFSFDSVGSGALYPLGLVAVGPVATAVGIRATLLGAATIVLVSILSVTTLRSVTGLQRLEDPTAAPGPI